MIYFNVSGGETLISARDDQGLIMNLDFYPPKRKIGFRSLISLEGILPSDIFEIIIESERLAATRRLKEKNAFFEKKTAILFTDKPQSVQRIAFERAAFFFGGQAIVIPVDRKDDRTAALKNIISAAKTGVDAVFVDIDGIEKASLPTDLPIINADSLNSPIFALAALLTAKREFGSLRNIVVKTVEDGKLSDVSVAFAKANAELILYSAKDSFDEKDVLYLSQFTSVTVESGAEKSRPHDLILYNSSSPLDLLQTVFNGTKKIIASTFNQTASLINSENAFDLSFSAALSTEDVIAAILSLISAGN